MDDLRPQTWPPMLAPNHLPDADDDDDRGNNHADDETTSSSSRRRRGLSSMSDDRAHRRRLQCRQSQKVFRDRRKHDYEQLIAHVHTLQNDIAQLQVRAIDITRVVPLPDVLLVQPDFEGGPWVKVVRTFMTLFQPGYNVAKRKASAKQEAFLRSVCRPDVGYNAMTGVESMLLSWQRYTDGFASIRMEPQSCSLVKTDDGPVVYATTLSHFKVSRTTLVQFFPHCPKYLRPLLLGQTLQVTSTMVWFFDKDDFVVRITSTSGLLAAIAAIVPQPDAVAAIFAGAQLKPVVPPAIAPESIHP